MGNKVVIVIIEGKVAFILTLGNLIWRSIKVLCAVEETIVKWNFCYKGDIPLCPCETVLLTIEKIKQQRVCRKEMKELMFPPFVIVSS